MSSQLDRIREARMSGGGQQGRVSTNVRVDEYRARAEQFSTQLENDMSRLTRVMSAFNNAYLQEQWAINEGVIDVYAEAERLQERIQNNLPLTKAALEGYGNALRGDSTRIDLQVAAENTEAAETNTTVIKGGLWKKIFG